MPSNEENSIEINNNLFSEDYDNIERCNSDFDGGDERDGEGEEYGY